MNYIVFDEPKTRINLLPLTFTRPVAEIRIGILTIREKWEKILNTSVSFKTEDYLSKKFPLQTVSNAHNIWINGAVCPNETVLNAIKRIKPNQALYSKDKLIALNSGTNATVDFNGLQDFEKIELSDSLLIIENLWDIFSKNEEAIKADFNLITNGRKSQPISATNQVVAAENIFIEEGAKVECAILNASTGPIYIGKDAEIMEGSIVRGPLALCEHAALKLGAKIYGPTTIGPYSKIGGEVNNSVIFAYSNKGHDGFLGNSVLGEWCNIGADSNNSNLKNNYAQVKLWNYASERFVNTGLTFCGLIMGDHSKCGINTMFNTGTVVGVSANIFGAGFPRNFVPSFSWGGAAGFTTYKLNDAFEVANRVFERRAKVFDDTEKEILSTVFEITEKYRK
jgi:UDP-N-acetylglucosamine diphosphorylase/glucosamine-1-phosphate N-acetyltransferase